MASAPDAGQADAVVVLGSDVDPDGRLVPEGSPASNSPGERLSAIGRLLQELTARALSRLRGAV